MKIAKIVLAGAVALAFISSAGLAQQATTGTTTGTGMITKINRISGTVAIRQTPDGTVGASKGAPETEFAVKGVSLDDLHVGERVKYSVTEAGGTKTVTKIDKQ